MTKTCVRNLCKKRIQTFSFSNGKEEKTGNFIQRWKMTTLLQEASSCYKPMALRDTFAFRPCKICIETNQGPEKMSLFVNRLRNGRF